MLRSPPQPTYDTAHGSFLNMISRTPFLLTAVLCLASVPRLAAQTSTGEIDVAVSDASEALVSGARVTVTGSDTGRGCAHSDHERRRPGRHSPLESRPLRCPRGEGRFQDRRAAGCPV